MILELWCWIQKKETNIKNKITVNMSKLVLMNKHLEKYSNEIPL